MRSSVKARSPGDNPRRSKKATALAAVEMHLVHAAADGTVAVVGVLIEPGSFNSQLEPIWAVMPDSAGSEVTMETLVDIDRLLPQDRRTDRYPGSLTTPPCSEGSKWNLMKTPISVSSGQVDTFKALYFFNARYTQPQTAGQFSRILQSGSRSPAPKQTE